MASIQRRAKVRLRRMINSAVAIVNNNTLRRRSHFARSATTNSYGPIPIDGDSSVPLIYSSQRSNSTTSTNSAVSIPGMGPVSNLIQVRSLEPSVDDLNAIHLTEAKPETEQENHLPKMKQFMQTAEYLFITDNRELVLSRELLVASAITHVIIIGNESPFMLAVSKCDQDKEVPSFETFHESDMDPDQSFENLASKFDNVNMFIEKARKIQQKILIFCRDRRLAFFVALQYNIDYYELEPEKAIKHYKKVSKEDWIDLPDGCMLKLQEWKNLGNVRRNQDVTKLGLSIHYYNQ